MALKINTYEQIILSFKQKEFKPIYFLMGEEPYFIDKISNYLIENLLNEDEKAFNQTVVYGKDTDIDSVINLARRYPVVAQRQLVVVKESQRLGSYDNLIYYLKQPMPTTVLVFCHKYGSVDKRKKIIAEISELGVLFESPKLYDNQLPAWITALVKTKGSTIDIKAANMMAEFLGSDLNRIESEIDKLFIAKGNSKNITPDLIEQNIGISKDFNNFELVAAISGKQIMKSNQIVDYFKKNKKNNPLVLTLSVLFNFFSNLLIYHVLPDKNQISVASALKINKYFVKDYQQAAKYYSLEKCRRVISYIRQTDAFSKGFGNQSTEDAELLKELVFKILH